jgi:hypothetical protein
MYIQGTMAIQIQYGTLGMKIHPTIVNTKCNDLWVLELVVFKHYRQQSMGKLFFVGFLIFFVYHYLLSIYKGKHDC